MFRRIIPVLPALLLTLAVAPPASADPKLQAALPGSYCIYDIGRVKGYPVGNTYVTPMAMNNRNQIVGVISNSSLELPQAFIWERGAGMRKLGTLRGHDTATAMDINDAGQVVGDSWHYDTGAQLSFIWDKRRGMRKVNASLGGGSHGATGINNLGQIVGASITAAGDGHGYFRDMDGDVYDLGIVQPGNPGTVAMAVNDLGQVVGADSGPLHSKGFLWTKRQGMRVLVAQEGVSFLPRAINNLRQVAGGMFAEATRPFLWTAGGGLQDLGSLGGSPNDWGEAFGLNIWGAVVGWSQLADGAGRPFIWHRRAGMRNLAELVDPGSALAPYVVLGVAKDINDIGAIVVEGRDVRDTEDGNRAYLLLPRRLAGRQGC